MPQLTIKLTKIEVQVYCGICGRGICAATTIDKWNVMTPTCPYCKRQISELEEELSKMKRKVVRLEHAK